LTADAEIVKKFQTEMNSIDNTLSFQNDNEKALYKLKAASNIFFRESLPEPLNQ